MKKPFIVLLATMVLILAAIPVVQSFRLSQQKNKLARMENKLEETSRQAEQSRAYSDRLADQRRELRQQVREQQRALAAIDSAQAATNTRAGSGEMEFSSGGMPSTSPASNQTAESKTSSMGQMISRMLEDPEMRKFVRTQQRQMLDPLYQPLIKRLGLSEEDAQAFKDFLADTQMRSAEQATAMLGGSATNRAKAIETLTADQKANEEQIRSFLGEEGYAAYQDYQQTLGERAQLNQYRMMNAGGENALTDAQTEWLLGVMKEEKQAVTTASGQMLPTTQQDPANLEAMLSGEGLDQMMRMQEEVNQRVYQRAAEGLSSDQLQGFGQFQTNQLQMMRMGMSMARQMFAPDGQGSGADSPAR